MDEKNKILITGTSRGIGLELARRFLKLGHQVLGVSRSKSPIVDEGFSEIEADLSDTDSVTKLLTQLEGHEFSGIIHNAGIHGPIGPLESNPIREWTQAFQVNLFSSVSITQTCIPSLRKNKGFITFLTGGGCAFPRPNFSAYSVSKTAVIRLSENLAKELAPDIFVYAIAPGPNKTALLDEAMASGTEVPPSELVGFDEPVRLCEFLAQNKDARYSGRFIHVKDPYKNWRDDQLEGDAHTLRRIKIT